MGLHQKRKGGQGHRKGVCVRVCVCMMDVYGCVCTVAYVYVGLHVCVCVRMRNIMYAYMCSYVHLYGTMCVHV